MNFFTSSKKNEERDSIIDNLFGLTLSFQSMIFSKDFSSKLFPHKIFFKIKFGTTTTISNHIRLSNHSTLLKEILFIEKPLTSKLKMLNVILETDSIVVIEVWRVGSGFLFKSSDEFIGKVTVDLKEIGISHEETISYNKKKLERIAEIITLSFSIRSYGINIPQSSMSNTTQTLDDDRSRESSVDINIKKSSKEDIDIDKSLFDNFGNFTGMGRSENERIKSKKYKILKQIGSGGFGEVFLIEKGGKLMALKKMYCKSGKEVNKAMKEVFFLQKYNHENIIEYYDVFFEEILHGPYKYSICFTMEYFEEKDLEQYLNGLADSGMKFLEEKVVISYFKQLARAVKYIHQSKLIHRDIKPSNIFIKSDFSELILGDFGLLKFVTNESCSITKSGTPKYQSPECFTSNESPLETTDLWSLGCTFFQIMNLKYEKIFYIEIFKNEKMHDEIRDELGSRYSEELVELVVMLMCKDPKKRISAKELIEKLNLLDNSRPSFIFKERKSYSPIVDSPNLKKFLELTIESPKKHHNKTLSVGNQMLSSDNIKNLNLKLKKVKNLKFKGGRYSGFVNIITNLPVGEGVLKFSRNEYYEGFFKTGEFHGRGKLFSSDGSLYEGDWVMSKKDGNGRMTWKGGSCYNGEWKDNKRNGIGEKINLNNTYYYGKWKKDKPLGEYIELGDLGKWLMSLNMQKYTSLFFQNGLRNMDDIESTKNSIKIIEENMSKFIERDDLLVIVEEVKKCIKDRPNKIKMNIDNVIEETRRNLMKVIKDENILNQMMKEMEDKIKKATLK